MEITQKHIDLVKKTIASMRFVIPHFVTHDDIFSAGLFGLWDASKRFDESNGNTFETFAGHRIKGAILDEVRRQDWFSRSAREKSTKLVHIKDHLQKIQGENVEDIDIAKELNMTLEEYQDHIKYLYNLGCVSLHETLDNSADGRCFMEQLVSTTEPPQMKMERKELEKEMFEYISLLTKKQKEAITLVFIESKTQKEAAKIIGVSAGRVSQLISAGLEKLKTIMENKNAYVIKEDNGKTRWRKKNNCHFCNQEKVLKKSKDIWCCSSCSALLIGINKHPTLIKDMWEFVHSKNPPFIKPTEGVKASFEVKDEWEKKMLLTIYKRRELLEKRNKVEEELKAIENV